MGKEKEEEREERRKKRQRGRKKEQQQRGGGHYWNNWQNLKKVCRLDNSIVSKMLNFLILIIVM